MPNRSPSKSAARCGRALSIDTDARDVTTRCNVLLGLWAARRLGLPLHEREAYAWSVHFADFEQPGHEDVIAKLSRDLALRGSPTPDREIRHQLREMELRAFLQLSAGRPRSSERRRVPGDARRSAARSSVEASRRVERALRAG